MTALLKTESYPSEDGRRGELSRKTSAYPWGNGAGGSMRQARIVSNGFGNSKKGKNWFIRLGISQVELPRNKSIWIYLFS